MDASNWIALGALLVSVVSLAASFVAGRKAERASSDAALLQAEVANIAKASLELERRRDQATVDLSRRAALRASIEHGQSDYVLVLVNDGPADAKNIVMLIDGQKPEQHCSWYDYSRQNVPAEMPASQIVAIQLAFDMQCGPPMRVELHWTDESPEPQSWSATLDFPA